MSQTKKIVIIEDDQSLREIYTIVFNEKDCQVKSFPCVHKSMRKIARFKPDIILIDIHISVSENFKSCCKKRSLKSPIITLVEHNSADGSGHDETLYIDAENYHLCINKHEYTPHQLAETALDVIELSL